MLNIQFGRNRLVKQYKKDKEFTLGLTPALVLFPDGRLLLSCLSLYVQLEVAHELFTVVPRRNLNKLFSIFSWMHLLLEIRRDAGAPFIVLLPATLLSLDGAGFDLTVSWIRAGVTLRFGSRTNPTDPSQSNL